MAHIKNEREIRVTPIDAGLAPGAFIGGEPKQTYAPGRTCALPDCGTPLSIYNPSPRCSVHGMSRVVPSLGKIRK